MFDNSKITITVNNSNSLNNVINNISNNNNSGKCITNVLYIGIIHIDFTGECYY